MYIEHIFEAMASAPSRSFGLFDADLATYRIEGIEDVATPALAIYADLVDANIAATLRLLAGDGNRWRPHVKTAKLACVMERLVERGVRAFKCATTRELSTACAAGASDVLLAYPVVGSNARRVQEIAGRFLAASVSVLVESDLHVSQWVGSPVGLYIDVNPGMNRTGIEEHRVDEVVRLAKEIRSAGLDFLGLHYYDGQLGACEPALREAVAHRGYDRLMQLVLALQEAGLAVDEVITAGTPTLPCSLSYPAFSAAPFNHRVSPGTIVYGDGTSLAQLPRSSGLCPAAVVVSTVVSHPTHRMFTADAGHKTVSADAGVPTCAVLGKPGVVPLEPSEEHLPMRAPTDSSVSLGEVVYLLPRHICPTVNNFDDALIVRGGRIVAVEPVTARGRDVPFTKRVPPLSEIRSREGVSRRGHEGTWPSEGTEGRST